MYTYDRQPKFDAERIRKIQSRAAAYEQDPPLQTRKSTTSWRVLVGAAPDGPLAREWRYTTDPPPDDWMTPGFDASAWKLGSAGFGQKSGWEAFIKTPWSTKDIWLRQEFDCPDATFRRAVLVIHYDNDTEVHVNGKPIWQGQKWNDRYDGFDVTGPLRQALRPGKNVIAVHCHQDTGGQFIDLALLAAGE